MTATPSLADRLEHLVDEASLRNVLQALSAVCAAKAEHLETNWQDQRSARVWHRSARACDRLADKLD